MFFPFLYAIALRTQTGVRLMQNLGQRYPRFWIHLGTFGIVIGILGMLFVSVEVIRSLVNLLINGSGAAAVGLVLPFKAKGVFYVPLAHWLIAILIVAVVHEFSHGLLLAAQGLRIKSAGFAFVAFFIPLIPAAFVEPDEKVLRKRPLIEQLRVYAAGPLANILLGGALLAVSLLLLMPLANAWHTTEGVRVTSFFDDSPAREAGIPTGALITSIDGQAMASTAAFQAAFVEKHAGDTMSLLTSAGAYNVILGGTAADPLLGVYVLEAKTILPQFQTWIFSALLWIFELIKWLALLNLGVGLFNLLPIGPIDGGRMLHGLLDKIIPHPHAVKITSHAVSGVLGAVVLSSIVLAIAL